MQIFFNIQVLNPLTLCMFKEISILQICENRRFGALKKFNLRYTRPSLDKRNKVAIKKFAFLIFIPRFGKDESLFAESRHSQ